MLTDTVVGINFLIENRLSNASPSQFLLLFEHCLRIFGRSCDCDINICSLCIAVFIDEACNCKSRAQHGYRQDFVQRRKKFAPYLYTFFNSFSRQPNSQSISFSDSSLAWRQYHPTRSHSRAEFVPPVPHISPRSLQQRPGHRSTVSFITSGKHRQVSMELVRIFLFRATEGNLIAFSAAYLEH